ncbi:MAG: aminotransferase class IV [Campylobacteraceae bacterium]|nr:aminotransferase class IV [Campylobacteraceae bacterium]
MEYFESIACEEFDVLNIAYHEKRIMNTISKNFSLSEIIYAPSNKYLKCKVIYNDDEIISVEYDLYKKREIKRFKIIEDNDINYSKKYLNRDGINKLFSQKEKADEIIILRNGFITDTSISNIVIFDGDNYLTPKNPLLYGTTRARYLEERKIFEKDITVEMLKNAKKLFLLNAMIDFDEIKDYSFLS